MATADDTPVAALSGDTVELRHGWELKHLIVYHLFKANYGQGAVILCPFYRRENWGSGLFTHGSSVEM